MRWYLVLLLCGQVFCQNKIIKIPREFDGLHIQKDFFVYAEPTETAQSIAYVSKQPFELTREKVSAHFASFVGHWIKFTLVSPVDQHVILNVGPLSYDELSFYQQLSPNKFLKYQDQSWQTPIDHRPLQSYFYGYDIQLKANTPQTFFMRGKNPKGTFRMPLKINSHLGFRRHLQQQHLFYGIFFGVGLFILLVGFSFYLLSKEVSYLYYFISVLTLILHNACLNGFFVDFMQRNFPFLADPTSSNILTVLFVFFHVRFVRELLLHKTKTPAFVYHFSRFLGAITLLLSFLMFGVFVNQNLYKAVSYIIYFIYVCMIVNFGLHIWQGFKYRKTNAFFITLSTTPFIILVCTLVLVNLRVIKQSTPYNVVMWCMMFDNIILCIGLAFRFNKVINRQVLMQKQINEQQQESYLSKIRSQNEQMQLMEAQYKMQLEKERISRELHDNIGSQLANITSDLDYYASAEQPNIKEKLSGLSTDVRYATQQLRDTIWTLSSEDVRFADWAQRVQNLFYKHFELSDTEVSFLNTCENPDLKLSSMQSLNLFRVFQEAFTNIKKHSKGTKVWVDMACKTDKLEILIKDNGRGISNFSKKTESYGLSNMKKRLIDLNGEMAITSDENGTAIKLSMPFNYAN